MAQQPPRTHIDPSNREKKPSIPSISPSTVSDLRMASILQPMKQNIELINGVRGGAILQLDSDATLEDVIAKVNEIIVRINF